MISDARRLTDPSIDCDLCVVGAGAAGISLCRQLKDSGLRIALLESGDDSPTAEALELNVGSKSGDLYPDLETSRLRGLGGTTNHWEGSCNRFTALDFERRLWVPDSGWPFDLAQLTPFYDRAHKVVELPSASFDVSEWSARVNRPVLKLDRTLIETMLSMTSPPTRFGITYGDELRAASNINVILNATATGVTRDSSGRRITRITAARDGVPPLHVNAKRFVLALGGLENPRFMLWAGLGNEHDLVGRYFMEHPVVRAARWVPTKTVDLGFYLPPEGPWALAPGSDAHLGVHFSFSDALLRSEKLSSMRMALVPLTQYEASEGVESFHRLRQMLREGNPSSSMLGHVWNVIRDLDMVSDGISRKVRGSPLFESADKFELIELQCMIEQYPEATNRVTLSGAKDRFGVPKLHLHWTVGRAEIDNLRRGVDILARAIGAAGLGRVENRVAREDFTWPPRHLGYGYHHMGTTRCHDDPKRGVVDRNLKVHGIDNLYVAGSSVFPTGGFVPPTLTIVALALRLADHLKES